MPIAGVGTNKLVGGGLVLAGVVFIFIGYKKLK